MAYKNKKDETENKRIYYLNHREIILARAKRWNKLHPKRIKEIKHKYNEKLKVFTLKNEVIQFDRVQDHLGSKIIMKMTNNKQNYFKIKDLLNRALDADNPKALRIRAMLDVEDVEKMQEFVARVEIENPKIEKMN